MRSSKLLSQLRDNPVFLRRHRSELARMLRLAERDVVDLTGRQLASLREENTLLRENLSRWYTHAAENDGMILCMHKFAQKIIALKGQITGGKLEGMLAKLLKEHTGIPVCKLAEANDGIKRLDRTGGPLAGHEALRLKKPLPGVVGKLPRGDWKTFLHVPVRRRRSLVAVLLVASEDAGAFPEQGHTDYVSRLAELVATALSPK